MNGIYFVRQSCIQHFCQVNAEKTHWTNPKIHGYSVVFLHFLCFISLTTWQKFCSLSANIPTHRKNIKPVYICEKALRDDRGSVSLRVMKLPLQLFHLFFNDLFIDAGGFKKVCSFELPVFPLQNWLRVPAVTWNKTPLNRNSKSSKSH